MKKLDFNRNWTVQKEGSADCRTVDLPHDAMLYEERDREAATAGASGYFREGKYTYRKRFTAPREWEEKRAILEFEGIYQNSVIRVNGKEAAKRAYGYSNFFVDLEGLLNYGEENEITAVADNSQAPNSRWYSGSGIYREVRLYLGEKCCIPPEGIKVTVLDERSVRVDVETTGNEEEMSGCGWQIEILDGETAVACAHENHAVLRVAGARSWSAETPCLYTCRARLIKEDSAPSETGTPSETDAPSETGAPSEVDAPGEIGVPAKILDEATTRFGFRTIRWGGEGLLVNGKPVLLRGGCIHHDNGILGAACFADAEERRVRLMKEAGFNAIRSAHNPVSKAMLDACDRLGMYMMDEAFDMWIIQKNPYDYGDASFRADWKADIASMVSKDYNHPSVILYSIGNEISELGTEEGQELCGELADYVRSLDRQRAVTCGINLMLATMAAKGKGLYGSKDGEDKGTGSQSMDSAPTSAVFNMMMNKMGGIMEKASATSGATKIAEAVAPMLDIPGYNYAGARYEKECNKYPGRCIVGSETLPKNLYKNWQMVKALPNLVGDFMWTSIDYLGESGIGTIRYTDKKTKKDTEEGLIVSGGPGVIDICGKLRPECSWNRIIWGLQKKPCIAAEPYTHAQDGRVASMWRDTDAVSSWSWEGCDGKKSTVVVYADADTVKLYVNRLCVGKQKVKECKAIFHRIAYAPGEIAAVAFDKNGNRVGKALLKSATGRTRIKLAPEKTILRPNGQDLCFIPIDLIGENGITRAAADQKLTVTVEGAGRLQAFGSARPHMAEDFVSTTHTTYYGKALAVVRAGYESGEIRVKVSGDGLEERTCTITVQGAQSGSEL